MGLRNWIMKEPKPTPFNLNFGRYTDLYKNKAKYTAWDLAIEHNNQDNHLESYKHLFEYLTDEKTNNFTYKLNDDGQYTFKFYQGSKLIVGHTDENYFVAKVKIAKCKAPNLSVFRKLLEENYNLKYTKYCLDEGNDLSLLFESSHLDANPYKLYYGLKELSSLADHKDDALTTTYAEFDPINNAHITRIDSHVLTAKYEYFIKETNEIIRHIETNRLTAREHVGSLSYLICSFAYKMDYLLVPEGKLMQSLDKLITLASAEESNPMHKNISETMSILHDYQKMKESDLVDEFYNSVYTFGVTSPVDHKHINHLIESNLEQLKWYVSKSDVVFSSAVCSYIIGKLLYENALPFYEKELMHLYYRITESTYFTTCGYPGLVKNGKIIKKDVIKELDKINSSMSSENNGYKLEYNNLLWHLDTFGPSFTHMVSNISNDR